MKTKFTAFLSVVTLLCLLAPVSVLAGTISYTYDNTGRLTGAAYGAEKTIQYTYDNNGNLLKRVVGTPTPGQYTLSPWRRVPRTAVQSPATASTVREIVPRTMMKTRPCN